MTGGEAARRRADRVLRAGLLDVEFYSALRGRAFPDERAAAVDFVSTGMTRRLSGHPLVDFCSLPAQIRKAWRLGRLGPVVDAVRPGEDGQGPLSAVADTDAARSTMLEWARSLGAQRPVSTLRADRVAGSLIDAEVVTVASAEASATLRTVRSVLRRADEDGSHLAVTVVDPGTPVHVSLALAALSVAEPRLVVHRVPEGLTEVQGLDLGSRRAAGAQVVLLGSGVEVRRGWLAPLRHALEDDDVVGAQALLIAPDDRIWSAGYAASGDRTVRLLEGHPKEDARGLDDQRFAAVSLQAVVLRAADLAAAGGVAGPADRAEDDVGRCRRLAVRPTGGFRVCPTSWVTVPEPATAPSDTGVSRPASADEIRAPEEAEVLARLGFVVADQDLGDGAGARTRVTGRRPSRPGALRWSLKLPSTRGAWGDDWGDTHFAEALASSLRMLGEDVVTCRRDAHASGPIHLDDVCLAVRGAYPVEPVPGSSVSVLWVISHPDEVTPDELAAFDLAFAASVPWSRSVTGRTGVTVEPLLQATGFPVRTPADPDDPALVFVGNAEDRRRPLVELADRAGVPLVVYGRGWGGKLAPGAWRGEYLPNDRLPELYRRHGAVLADHWPAMAAEGFVANRVFDALACGARVVCDPVLGIEELLGEAVSVCRTVTDVQRAFDRPGRGPAAPPPVDLSFDDRAAFLHARVRSLR